MDKEKWAYFLIRALTFPCGFMPYTWLHRIGKILGTFAFYFMREYRKKALSNLALAKRLNFSHKELIYYAKKSFQNLAINCLEYPKLAQETDFSRVVRCENPEVAQEIYAQGKGIIFFCGHQSNWEVLFLDGTARMNGVAIGKSIKNKRLYNWIVSIRQKNGGIIIAPRNAVKEGFRALKRGAFMGIVGDQGMPDSSYSFPFLGRRAWTSTAPALLAYKAHCPIIFAAIRRSEGGYRIRYSDPIWPDLTRPVETEVVRMMDQALSLLQESIVQSPGEWLWQHNRWKQQTAQSLHKRFRQDCICVILPEENFEAFLAPLQTLKQIYPLAFLSFVVPKRYSHLSLIEADEVIYYTHPRETLLTDLRFKLVFNFTSYKSIHAHYESLSAFEVLDLAALKKLAAEHLRPHHDLSDLLKRALCRPGFIWYKEDHAC